MSIGIHVVGSVQVFSSSRVAGVGVSSIVHILSHGLRILVPLLVQIIHVFSSLPIVAGIGSIELVTSIRVRALAGSSPVLGDAAVSLVEPIVCNWVGADLGASAVQDFLVSLI